MGINPLKFLFIAIFVITGCQSSDDPDNSPVVPPPTICQDANASNEGSNLPCQCNPGFIPSQSGLSCEVSTAICIDEDASNVGMVAPCQCPQGEVPSSGNQGILCVQDTNICQDVSASNFGDPIPCVYGCQDPEAINVGSPGACEFLCSNSQAVNNGEPEKCEFRPQVVYTIWSATFYPSLTTNLTKNKGTETNCYQGCTYSNLTLPTGFSLNPTTGQISVNSSSSSIPFNGVRQIRAVNSLGHTNDINVSIAINYPPPPVGVVTNNSLVYGVNGYVDIDIRYDDSTPSQSIAGNLPISPTLPAGLSLVKLDNLNYKIQGVPTEARANTIYTLRLLGPEGQPQAPATARFSNTTFSFSVEPPPTISYECPTGLPQNITCVDDNGVPFFSSFQGENNTSFTMPAISTGSNLSFEIIQPQISLISGISFNTETGRFSATNFLETSQNCNASYQGLDFVCEYDVRVSNGIGSAMTKVRFQVLDRSNATGIFYDPAELILRADEAVAITYPNPILIRYEDGNAVNCAGEVGCFTISPALPEGLNFDSTSGAISGLPTKTAVQLQTPYTITANETVNNVPRNPALTATINIDIRLRVPIFTYANANFDFLVGDQISNIVINPLTDTQLCGQSFIPLDDFTVSPPLISGLELVNKVFNCNDPNDQRAGTIKGIPGEIINLKSFVIEGCNEDAFGRRECHQETINIQTNPKILSLVSGKNHHCALIRFSDGNQVSCWGDNTFGQLGRTTTNLSNPDPGFVLNSDNSVLKGVIEIKSGENFVCAKMSTQEKVKCWGDNLLGQMGTVSAMEPRAVFIRRQGSDVIDIKELALGTNKICYTRLDQELDEEFFEQLYCSENGNFVSKETGFIVRNIAVGSDHVCFMSFQILVDDIDSVGRIKCFGDNSLGQLGNGTTINNSPTAVQVIREQGNQPLVFSFANQSLRFGTPGAERPVVGGNPIIQAGLDHTCILINTTNLAQGDPRSEMFCWGDNSFKQLAAGASAANFSNRALAEEFTLGGSRYSNISLHALGTYSIKTESALCNSQNNPSFLNCPQIPPIQNPPPVNQYLSLMYSGPDYYLSPRVYREGLPNLQRLTSKQEIYGNVLFASAGPGADSGICSLINEQIDTTTFRERVYCDGRNDRGQRGNGLVVPNNTQVMSESATRVIWDQSEL